MLIIIAGSMIGGFLIGLSYFNLTNKPIVIQKPVEAKPFKFNNLW